MGSIEQMLDPEIVVVMAAMEREGSIGRALMEDLLLGKEKEESFRKP